MLCDSCGQQAHRLHNVEEFHICDHCLDEVQPLEHEIDNYLEEFADWLRNTKGTTT